MIDETEERDESAIETEKKSEPDTMQFTLDGTKKMTTWAKEPTLLLLKGDLEAAKPSHQTHVQNIQKWNDLLNVEGDAKPKKISGHSAVQPKLIRRQAEWRYSALSEPFLSSDKLFKVEPVTFEDGAAAKQNELLLNYQFRTKLNRTWLIDNLVRATVDEGTCIVRLGWCRTSHMESVEVPVYSHYPVNPQDPNPQVQQYLQQFQQAVQMKQADPRSYNEQVPPELQACVDLFEEQGIPTFAQQTGVQTNEEEKIDENHPTVEPLNPVNVFIDPSCQGELDRALFMIVSFETNKSELAKYPDRYKNLHLVNWDSNTSLTDTDHESRTPDTFAFKDSARKKVVAYEYWGFYDIDGNDTLKPIVATWIGEQLIRMEENPFPDGKLPFVVIPYLPIKRELYGEPDAEMLEDNQKILGAVTRGMIDLLGQSANGQKGFAKGMLDPVNRRKYENGQDYEFNAQMPTTQGVIEHKYPELPTSALTMLQLQNQEAEALTGVKSFGGGLSGNAYGNVATGIRGMLDAAAKREMAILRRIAKGVSDIGRKILAMNSMFLSDEEVVRVTNKQFVSIKREELQGEFDLTVDISTFEVDNTKAQDLGFMLQTLGPNMDPSISMMILSEIAELKRMPVLAERLRNWHPQPDPVQQQLQQLELQLKQAEIQKIQSDIMLNQAKAQQAQATAGLKQLDAVEQESGTKHARKMVETQAQARSNQHLEITKALLKGRKPDESAPDVQSAIGYNTLSTALEEQNLLGPNR
jgi:hypothetical protein